jgi:alpha-1,6-mannosyltransferase
LSFSAKTLLAITLIVFISCIIYIGYIPSQKDFIKIIIPYTIAFIGYAALIKSPQHDNLSVLIIAGLVVRFVLIFAFPNLSDDIYRFIWDGRMLHQGLNPYATLPSDLVNAPSSLSRGLYDQLNSQQYYSIYPPISQLFNYLATVIESDSFYIESIIYKTLLFSSDLCLLPVLRALLKNLNIPTHHLLWYYLNPLVILETMGNCHFEGVMVLLLAMTLYFLTKSQPNLASGYYSLSIGAKLLPLLFAPALFQYLRTFQKHIIFTLLSIGFSIVLFSPLLMYSSEIIANLGSSLDLYVKKFEFNGGIYFALRYLGYKIYGYNLIHIIGPFLSLLTLFGILFISFRYKIKSMDQMIIIMLSSYMIFILLSRTIHPWYTIMAVFLCVLCNFRFAIVWSYLIGWTYINYSYTQYHENMLIVAIEFLILIVLMIFEYKNHDNNQNIVIQK